MVERPAQRALGAVVQFPPGLVERSDLLQQPHPLLEPHHLVGECLLLVRHNCVLPLGLGDS